MDEKNHSTIQPDEISQKVDKKTGSKNASDVFFTVLHWLSILIGCAISIGFVANLVYFLFNRMTLFENLMIRSGVIKLQDVKFYLYEYGAGFFLRLVIEFLLPLLIVLFIFLRKKNVYAILLILFSFGFDWSLVFIGLMALIGIWLFVDKHTKKSSPKQVCTNCHKEVPLHYTVGMHCPHCGAIFVEHL